MALLRPIPRRTERLPVSITEELAQRLRTVRKRCKEHGMELPLESLVEDFLSRLLDGAEKELAGAPPCAKSGRKPERTTRQGSPASTTSAAAMGASGNGDGGLPFGARPST